MSARISIADVVRQPAPGLDHPGDIAFTPDGAALTYLHGAEGTLVRSLWWHDLATGARHVIAAPQAESHTEEMLSHEERLDRERRRISDLGVTAFAWSSAANGRTLLARSGGTVLAALDATPDADLRPVSAAAGATAAVLSPDGRRLAFVLDGDVSVCELPDGEARRLTADAELGLGNGLADFAASEELDRHDGMWWSADGRRLLAAQVDERGVPPFLIPHLSSDAPHAETHRYPFAGGPNARVRLRLLDLEGHGPEALDLPMRDGDYLARVVPRPDGGWLVAVLPRAQRSLAWFWIEPHGPVRAAWSESADPWMNLDLHTRVLADGRVLRSSEASGFRHLELRGPDGRMERVLTTGPWVVTDVSHVDEERREVLFIATRDGVTERHLYAVSLDAPAPVADPLRLTSEPGWHVVTVSRDGERWADTWSTVRTPPRIVVRNRDGSEHADVHGREQRAPDLGLVVPEFRELTGADGSTPLRVALYRPVQPRGTDGRPPPAVLSVYGGPHQQNVTDSWSMTVAMQRQALCSAGAVVVVADNRGSASRGLAFEGAIAGAFGDAEVADQATVLRQLAAEGILDASRVAVTGGSYGGYMTIRCMQREPDLFRAGVAIAPVTAWDGYDTAYTERYLGDPAIAGDAYRSSSLLAEAAALRGELLIIHGELDENVHLRHTLRLLAALQGAGRKAPPLVILAGQRHRTRGTAALTSRESSTLEHLSRALGLAPIP